MMAEGFPTYITFIWLLSSVNPLVHSKGRAIPEGFVTDVTLVGLLPCVNSPVLIKSYVVTKGLPTISAIKGFLLCMVVPPVTNKGRVLYEGFPTLNTLVRLLASVTSLMTSKG